MRPTAARPGPPRAAVRLAAWALAFAGWAGALHAQQTMTAVAAPGTTPGAPAWFTADDGSFSYSVERLVLWPTRGFAPVAFSARAAANVPLELRADNHAHRQIAEYAALLWESRRRVDAGPAAGGPWALLCPASTAGRWMGGGSFSVRNRRTGESVNDPTPPWQALMGAGRTMGSGAGDPVLFLGDGNRRNQIRVADFGVPIQEFDAIPLDRLPDHWMGYAGMFGALYATPKELAGLSPAQGDALAFWVRWAGGRLLIGVADDATDADFRARMEQRARERDERRARPEPHGRDEDPLGPERALQRERFAAAGRALAERGLDLAGLVPELPMAGMRRYAFGTGDVRLFDDRRVAARIDQAAFEREPRGGATPLPAFTGGFFPWYGSGENGIFADLFESLDVGLSAWTIGAMLVVFGLLLGPVNYLLVRRRKTPLLFFFTTPALALAGSFAIAGLATLLEGVSARRVESTLLVVDENAAAAPNARLFAARVVYSGLSTPTPAFSADTLAYPLSAPLRSSSDRPGRLFRGRGQGDFERRATPYVTDFTDGLRLSGGWIAPREKSGLLTARPVAAVAGVDAEYVPDGGGDVALHNRLRVPLLHLSARLPDGMTVWVEGMEPGERRVVPAAERVRPGTGRAAPRAGLAAEADVWRSVAEMAVSSDAPSSGVSMMNSPAGQGVAGVFGVSMRFESLRVIAECGAPPVMPEDGGIGGRIEGGRHFYIQMADPRGAAPLEGVR